MYFSIGLCSIIIWRQISYIYYGLINIKTFGVLSSEPVMDKFKIKMKNVRIKITESEINEKEDIYKNIEKVSYYKQLYLM